VRTAAGRVQVAVLVCTGAGAALLSTFLDLHLGVPGSRIIYSIFPMALGFAVAPRRGAGSVMGIGAVATAGLLGLGGARLPGVGGLTSLFLVGPLLDIALRWGRSGWRLYGAFIAAGALANAAAFAMRAAGKLAGWRGAGGGLRSGRALAEWLPLSVWTYAVAGVVAGLVSAVAWFHLREPRRGSPNGPG
jgi:hypothetical protein